MAGLHQWINCWILWKHGVHGMQKVYGLSSCANQLKKDRGQLSQAHSGELFLREWLHCLAVRHPRTSLGWSWSSILYISLNLRSKGHIETKGSCKPLRANTCLSRSDTRPRNLAVNNFSLSHESQLKQQRWRTLGQWKVKISLAICRQSIL